MEIAAIIYTILVTVVVLFQGALALGAPWGEYAMGGGRSGAYTPQLRVTALVQGVVLALTAFIVLAEANVQWTAWSAVTRVTIWFVVGMMGLSSVLNLITQSAWERRIWAPVAIVLLITSLIVALG